MGKGLIMGFRFSAETNYGYFDIKDSRTGNLESLIIPNSWFAGLAEALHKEYGDFIISTNKRNMDRIRGKEIYYEMNDEGLFLGFSPVEDASEKLKARHENEAFGPG